MDHHIFVRVSVLQMLFSVLGNEPWRHTPAIGRGVTLHEARQAPKPSTSSRGPSKCDLDLCTHTHQLLDLNHYLPEWHLKTVPERLRWEQLQHFHQDSPAGREKKHEISFITIFPVYW